MKEFLTKVWSYIEKNRWTMICLAIGIGLWLTAASCTPVVQSPTTGQQVNAVELANDLDVYMMEHQIILKKFDAAEADIQAQIAQMEKIKEVIMTLASGNVADVSGLVTLLLGSGAVGVVADNFRKNGVIAGLKRNKV